MNTLRPPLRVASLYYFLLAGLLVSSLSGCHREMDPTQQNSSPELANSPTEGMANFSYEVETVRFTKINPSAGTTLAPTDQLRQMPTVQRNAIRMVLYSDGTMEQQFKVLPPRHTEFLVKDLTPPDNTPATVLTRINRKGLMSFYAAGDQLKNTYQMPQLPDFTGLVNQLKQQGKANNGISFNPIFLQSGGVPVSMEEVIAHARAQGATVTQLSGNRVSIQTAASPDNPAMAQARTLNDATYVEDIYDTQHKTVILSKIYDRRRQPISWTAFRYEYVANQSPKLVQMHQEALQPAQGDGQIRTAVTEMYVEHTQVNINLPR